MKRLILLTNIIIILFALIPEVYSHCPLCTTGAVVGVGLTRSYGIDDSIVGLFLGALIVSSALWFNKWLKKRVNFPVQEILLMVFSFLAVVIPLYYAGLITDFEMVKSMPEHHSMLGFGVLGIDKLLLGTIIGTLVIWFVFTLSDSIKKERGKVLFPYQGVSFMSIALIVLSLTFWVITK